MQLQRDGRLHRCVWMHRIGTDAAEDPLVFGADESEPARPGVSITPDGRWLVVALNYGTGTRNDLWVAELAGSDPSAPEFTAVQGGLDAVTTLHIHDDGCAYVRTNLGASRYRLCVARPDRLSPEAWQELVPESPEANLEEFAVVDDQTTGRTQLLVAWTRHALSELTVHDGFTGRKLTTLPLPSPGTAGHLLAPPEGGGHAWFEYTDPITPPTIWRYDAVSRTADVETPAPQTAQKPVIHFLQAVCTSKDGTEVRLSLFAADPEPRPSPTILHAYGGFGRQRRPRYTASVLAWIEAGGLYAVAHVRGGGEQGTAWHHAGTGPRKQKSFDDLVAAAHWLIDEGWTTPQQLCLSGGSNGGLLVSAVMTQQPELCNAVVASAPLLDMVRYEHYGLGALWTREYGTARDPQQLEWLLSYSPYHHVTPATAYPAVLFTVFDHDTRVHPLHARKMCAALQWATSSDRPVLLRREADVGHGPRALSRAIDVAADALAFAAHHTGLRWPVGDLEERPQTSSATVEETERR